MHTPAPVRQFIREVLGCECPDHVFESLAAEHRSQPSPRAPYQWRLVVGERLLIYLLALDSSLTAEPWLEHLREYGSRDRVDSGLNRFRAVVVLDDAAPALEQPQGAVAAWASHPHLHLHWVSRRDAADCVAALAGGQHHGLEADPNRSPDPL
ncbi:MAG: hypothetical protein AMJ69_01040 [Gammaproteobacteria bacterium SG8_47]|nr:MAG: hypothetical protein AMJ69_01040 [Gammaproteobacteria bacterium SG8_47]